MADHEPQGTTLSRGHFARPLGAAFSGFDVPSANFTYTPNQFFDVCLPHYSRGVVRLVAYMIRQTLGWCDEDGNPLIERVRVSYADLEREAGLSHSMIRKAIEEAIEGGFLRRIKTGKPKQNGSGAVNSEFELRWDSGAEYVRNPKEFRGFFEGEGNRTNIPNQFFDVIVPTEPLSVIKVVGSVIRFSIGFQTSKGGRRQRVALSYQDIQNYARIGSRADLSSALHHSIDANYIVLLEAGVFDLRAGKESRAATYGLRWLDSTDSESIGMKSVPDALLADEVTRTEIGMKSEPGDGYEIRTGMGMKSEPGNRYEIRTDIKRKYKNKTFKQQQEEGRPRRGAVAAAENADALKLLKTAGFDDRVARDIASRRSLEAITNQVSWLSSRAPKQNPQGLLRRAIEENWPEPISRGESCEQLEGSPAALFASHFYAAFGGNTGKPVARPSVADLAEAERYLGRLVEISPSLGLAPKWGEAFGRLCLTHNERRKPGIVSFTAMLRSHGDEFLARHEQGRANEVRTSSTRSRALYEAEQTPAWLAYVAAAESRFRAERRDDYEKFTAHREEEREKVTASPWKLIREKALAHLDSDEGRLKDFQEFFPEEIPDFWRWDEAQNRQAAG